MNESQNLKKKSQGFPTNCFLGSVKNVGKPPGVCLECEPVRYGYHSWR